MGKQFNLYTAVICLQPKTTRKDIAELTVVSDHGFTPGVYLQIVYYNT